MKRYVSYICITNTYQVILQDNHSRRQGLGTLTPAMWESKVYKQPKAIDQVLLDPPDSKLLAPSDTPMFEQPDSPPDSQISANGMLFYITQSNLA